MKKRVYGDVNGKLKVAFCAEKGSIWWENTGAEKFQDIETGGTENK